MSGLSKLLLIAFAVLATAASSGAEEIAIIVNEKRSANLDRNELARIFLKQRRFWSDGAPILPVNREAGADLRGLFEKLVFGSNTRRLPVYWNRAYFRGVLPPATLASDEAVRRFVTREPRAIGYIRASAVDASVKVVLLLRARAGEPSP